MFELVGSLSGKTEDLFSHKIVQIVSVKCKSGALSLLCNASVAMKTNAGGVNMIQAVQGFGKFFIDRFLPLSPHPPWCLSCSGARVYVWDSETVFPPPPNRTLTGPFEHDDRGEGVGETRERYNVYLLFSPSAEKA